MTREGRKGHLFADAGNIVHRSAPVQRDYMALGVGAVPYMGAVGCDFLYCCMGGNQKGR